MESDARVAAVSARFETGAVLESGACWTVCRATERGTGRAVVLRIVEDDRLAQDANRQRFLAEAKQIAALTHPGLIPLVEAGAEGRFGWTASNPANGPSLRELLARGPLPPDEVARAGEQVAAALDAAHTRGIVHRDLRPEQVVQVAPGAYRLGGFGTGRWMMAGARRSDGTPVAGLPSALAPEMLGGGPATVSTDIHALGALLFELATGAHPYAAADDFALLGRLAHEQPARPGALVPGLAPEVDQAILRALSKDPASRQVTAAAVQQALAACAGAAAAPARRQRTIPTWAEMLRASQGPFARARRAALVLVPVVALGGTLAFLLQTREPGPNADLMQRALAQIRKHPSDLALRIQFGEQLERAGRVDDARQLYEDALKADPKYARALCGIAHIEDRESRPDLAQRTYRKAVAADPGAWYAALDLARLLVKDNRRNEARVVLEQALAVTPGQPDLKEELARVSLARRR